MTTDDNAYKENILQPRLILGVISLTSVAAFQNQNPSNRKQLDEHPNEAIVKRLLPERQKMVYNLLDLCRITS